METSGILIIRRPKGFVDRVRSYRILVDGEEAASLRADSSATIPVPPGTHVVHARIDWTSSPRLEIDVDEGATVTLECSGHRNPLVAVFHTLIRRDEYLQLKLI